MHDPLGLYPLAVLPSGRDVVIGYFERLRQTAWTQHPGLRMANYRCEIARPRDAGHLYLLAALEHGRLVALYVNAAGRILDEKLDVHRIVIGDYRAEPYGKPTSRFVRRQPANLLYAVEYFGTALRGEGCTRHGENRGRNSRE